MLQVYRASVGVQPRSSSGVAGFVVGVHFDSLGNRRRHCLMRTSVETWACTQQLVRGARRKGNHFSWSQVHMVRQAGEGVMELQVTMCGVRHILLHMAMA